MAVLPLRRDGASAPFFDAASAGRLLLRRCRPVGHWNAPAALTCTECGQATLEWADSAGTGSVLSWAVVHHKPGPAGTPAATPVAIVQLDEGPWLRGPLRLAEGARPRSGLRVRVAFERAGGGEPVPVFLPDPAVRPPR
ncbi:MAG: uncharacterized protein QOG76_5497 [Pseudonocardiales bacterium]|jgi:uncharacterized protein|nr:uncharacterized protein [Pseudonocardiales bacterium]